MTIDAWFIHNDIVMQPRVVSCSLLQGNTLNIGEQYTYYDCVSDPTTEL